MTSANLRSAHPARTTAMVVAAVFLLVGILGFIPGATTDYDGMAFAGHESTAMLLGVFHVSILHNIVHLLFGIAGIALARTWNTARTYLLGAGVLYIILFLYGILVTNSSDVNFVPINSADDWLHLVLGVALLGSWYISRESAATTATPSTSM